MDKRLTHLNLFFSTPIWTSIIPNYKNINEKMMNYINTLRTNNPTGKIRSNMLGWHSENFKLQDPEPDFYIKNISPILNEALIDMGWDLNKNEIKISSMWTIINPTNASNARHIHSNNFISAAYYLKAPENCGDIHFYDPREQNIIRTPIIKETNKLNLQVINIMPKEGLLVLFPSYLYHSVGINKSNEERIVLSFNINLIY